MSGDCNEAEKWNREKSLQGCELRRESGIDEFGVEWGWRF